MDIHNTGKACGDWMWDTWKEDAYEILGHEDVLPKR
jgi:hypothetical protein